MARREASPQRKLIAFDPETWMALDLLAQDRMASIQDLADEAFADLLKKHHRPTTLKAALRESSRTSAGGEAAAARAAPARGRSPKRR
jgi:hypothetical protein